MSDSDSEFKIDLCSDWAIRRDGETQALAVNFPADIHSVLLAADRIEDPYWRDNETSLDWIHESEWIATRPFDMPDLVDDQYVLTLSGVDCQSIVSLNGKPVGELGNCFRRYDLDITDALASGPNLLQIRFLSNSAVAREKADAFPFSVPYIHWNNRLAHYNFLRKPQCDAGWDWNIALSPLGVYGEIALRKVDAIDLIDTAIRQHHSNQHVVVEVDLHTHVQSAIQAIASLEIGEQRIEESVDLYPDYCKTTLALKIDNPRLWWPVGHGAQAMYNASIQIGNQRREFKIGLRQVELITDSDAIGHRFAFRINGCEIFMRGANWISADALPSGATRAVVADLLDSAIDANMNMLRVWGGGTYQPDWFYEMCSERGLMIWQDFMFACNLYPAADRNWLNEVRTEAQQQVRRLSAYPCLTLWCGDNELVGAINWFEESKHDRDRYLAMYDRLNYALQETVEDEAIGVPWWPSSPCSGLLNFGDGWHDDTTGDMHFWDVWHAAKDFEHYRTVQPRFCSEFGFQSLPSAALIETFTEAHDRNVSSPVMDVHQRNAGGNSRIVETLARYFRFPEGFTEMCWLSQVSQALAMKTAIECWRSSKPRCMGTLFWQLNDTWPVASWSSIEYGGAWKLTQYLARRFYAPILVTAQPDSAADEIVIWAINDTTAPVSLSISACRVDIAGPMESVGHWACACPPDRAIEIARMSANTLKAQEFMHLRWHDEAGVHIGENEFLARRPKEFELAQPTISIELEAGKLRLSTDVPALFVTIDHGGANIWSDNGFTLLPGSAKTLTLQRDRGGLKDNLSVSCLNRFCS